MGFSCALFSVTSIASSCQKESKGQSIRAWEDVKETMRSFSLQDFHAARLKQRDLPSSSAVLQLTIYLSCKSAPDSSFKWGTDTIDNGLEYVCVCVFINPGIHLKAAKRTWRTKLVETRNDQTLHSWAKRIVHKSTRRTGLGEEDPEKKKKVSTCIYIIYLHHAAPAEWMSFISTTQLKNLQERLQ